MRLMICSIFDAKVGVYSPPMLYKTKGEAIRAFTDAVNDPQLPFKRHPEDYRLFYMGDWEDTTGELLSPRTPEPLIGAAEVG